MLYTDSCHWLIGAEVFPLLDGTDLQYTVIRLLRVFLVLDCAYRSRTHLELERACLRLIYRREDDITAEVTLIAKHAQSAVPGT